MRYINELFYMIVTTSLSGAILTGCWFFINEHLEQWITVSTNYRLLKLLMVFYLVPIFFVKNIISGWIYPDSHSRIWMMDLCSPLLYWFALIFFIVWSLGFVASLIYFIGRICWFHFNVSVLNGELIDQETVTTMEKVRKDLHISRKIKVYQNDMVTTPCITGILFPKILLPDKIRDLEALRVVLTHELTHYKKKDVLVKRFGMAIRCIHWFNPLAYKLSNLIGIWSEYSCDYDVCHSRKRVIDSKQYVNSILLLAFKNPEAIGIDDFISSLQKNDRILERRMFKVIKQKKNTRKMRVISALIAVAMLNVGALTVFAAEQGTTLLHRAGYEASKVETTESSVTNQLRTMVDGVMEYEEAFDPNFKPIEGPSAPLSRAYYIYDWEIPAGQAYKSKDVWLGVGDTMKVTVLFRPLGVTAKWGMIEPDGVRRYIISESSSHIFQVRKLGFTSAYVENTTGATLKVNIDVKTTKN